MKKILIVLIGLLLVSTVFAQPRKGRKPMGKPRMEKRLHKEHQKLTRGQRRERMEEMMALKMTEELDLTTKQAEKFFPLSKEHRDRMDKIDSNIHKINTDFHKKAKDDKKITDKEIDGVFAKIHELEQKKLEERYNYQKSLKGVLDNEQRAKLMTFKQRFARGIEERLKVKRKKLEEYKEELKELEEN